MGWVLSNLKGIIIILQYRLNTNIKEVVRNKIVELLEARMIYQILDSIWVSLVQLVSKKSGMTIIKNEKNELIPTRNGGECV